MAVMSLTSWLKIGSIKPGSYECCYKFTYLMANSADPDQLAS